MTVGGKYNMGYREAAYAASLLWPEYLIPTHYGTFEDQKLDLDPLIGLWLQMLRIPYRLLHPIILLLCCIGVYSLNGSALEVGLMALFGLLGYALLKLGFEPAPMLLGFVLGSLMEENLRRALAVSRGDAWVFVTRPISATLLAVSLLLLLAVLLPKVSRVRQDAFQE